MDYSLFYWINKDPSSIYLNKRKSFIALALGYEKERFSHLSNKFIWGSEVSYPTIVIDAIL